MKSTQILVLVLLSISMCRADFSGIGYTCFKFLEAGNGFYNLDKINTDEPMQVSLATTSTGEKGTLYFNPCHPITVDGCKAQYNTIGFVKTATTCIPLSAWAENTENSEARTKWVFDALAPVNSFAAIKEQVKNVQRLLQTNLQAARVASEDIFLGDAVDFGDKKGLSLTADNLNGFNTHLDYNFNVKMNCNYEVEETKDLVGSWDAVNKIYNVSFTNKAACSFDVFSFWKKLGWGRYIVGGVISALCLAMCFAGIKMYKPSIGVLGFLAGGFAVYVLLSMFWGAYEDADWAQWVIIAISLLAGVAVCLAVVCLERVGIAAAGAFLGYVLGNMLYNLVLFRLDGMGSPVWYYVTVIVIAVVFGILSCWLADWIVILATSFGGAYISVKLVGIMIGNYPDESFIAQEIASGEFDSMPWQVYLYLSIMVVLAIAGLIVQIKLKKDSDDEDRKQSYNHIM